MRLYPDLCCLNRPFDDQSQPRVARETVAVLRVLETVAQEWHQLVDAEPLRMEIRNHTSPIARGRLRLMLRAATLFVPVDARVAARCRTLMLAGFGGYDALHLASAEASAGLFLTTDDRLLRRAARYDGLSIIVRNPTEAVLRGVL